MIRKLIIKNYALIDELEIDFSEGLSIITGETGAGKSIMLGALGLLLGERADTKAIADKSRKTIVEATFELKRKSPDTAIEEPEDIELIVRREIAPNGRSRAFIDDSPVTLVQLAACTQHLLDIHSQHANLSLTSREGQLRIIDAMADNEELLADYREMFRNYVAIRNRLRRIKEEKARSEDKRDTLTFQLEQLKKLNVKVGEQEEVERQFELLSDADEIKERLKAASYLLVEGESSAMSNVAEAIGHLDSISSLIDADSEDENTVQNRLNEIQIEIKDIGETLARRADTMESSPALLAKAQLRMKELYDAVRTFHVKSADDLVELRAKIEKELGFLSGDNEEGAALEREARQLAKLLKDMALKLSERREEAADGFSVRLMELARPLGLHNLRFEVHIDHSKLNIDGQDVVEFRCSFNKNGDMLPMAMTASGGELSRLTLSIKSLMAEKMEMPTVIFDEVDTGVSGEIAAKMGGMMVRMGRKIQVLAITHLPQVAAQGQRHYKVYKRDTSERTISTITELNEDERVKEIAGMLSGEQITDAALEAARVLVESRINNK
ncbi:MAG: DNA repair protein RecN [Muribaculaceae bacterium]|nr:DNA repair protein RecN [Muribaculaceae bacterium]